MFASELILVLEPSVINPLNTLFPLILLNPPVVVIPVPFKVMGSATAVKEPCTSKAAPLTTKVLVAEFPNAELF